MDGGAAGWRGGDAAPTVADTASSWRPRGAGAASAPGGARGGAPAPRGGQRRPRIQIQGVAELRERRLADKAKADKAAAEAKAEAEAKAAVLAAKADAAAAAAAATAAATAAAAEASSPAPRDRPGRGPSRGRPAGATAERGPGSRRGAAQPSGAAGPGPARRSAAGKTQPAPASAGAAPSAVPPSGGTDAIDDIAALRSGQASPAHPVARVRKPQPAARAAASSAPGHRLEWQAVVLRPVPGGLICRLLPGHLAVPRAAGGGSEAERRVAASAARATHVSAAGTDEVYVPERVISSARTADGPKARGPAAADTPLAAAGDLLSVGRFSLPDGGGAQPARRTADRGRGATRAKLPSASAAAPLPAASVQLVRPRPDLGTFEASVTHLPAAPGRPARPGSAPQARPGAPPLARDAVAGAGTVASRGSLVGAVTACRVAAPSASAGFDASPYLGRAYAMVCPEALAAAVSVGDSVEVTLGTDGNDAIVAIAGRVMRRFADAATPADATPRSRVVLMPQPAGGTAAPALGTVIGGGGAVAHVVFPAGAGPAPAGASVDVDLYAVPELAGRAGEPLAPPADAPADCAWVPPGTDGGEPSLGGGASRGYGLPDGTSLVAVARAVVPADLARPLLSRVPLGSASVVVREYGESPQVQAALARPVRRAGPPPTDPATGLPVPVSATAGDAALLATPAGVLVAAGVAADVPGALAWAAEACRLVGVTPDEAAAALRLAPAFGACVPVDTSAVAVLPVAPRPAARTGRLGRLLLGDEVLATVGVDLVRSAAGSPGPTTCTLVHGALLPCEMGVVTRYDATARSGTIASYRDSGAVHVAFMPSAVIGRPLNERGLAPAAAGPAADPFDADAEALLALVGEGAVVAFELASLPGGAARRSDRGARGGGSGGARRDVVQASRVRVVAPAPKARADATGGGRAVRSAATRSRAASASEVTNRLAAADPVLPGPVRVDVLRVGPVGPQAADKARTFAASAEVTVHLPLGAAVQLARTFPVVLTPGAEGTTLEALPHLAGNDLQKLRRLVRDPRCDSVRFASADAASTGVARLAAAAGLTVAVDGGAIVVTAPGSTGPARSARGPAAAAAATPAPAPPAKTWVELALASTGGDPAALVAVRAVIAVPASFALAPGMAPGAIRAGDTLRTQLLRAADSHALMAGAVTVVARSGAPRPVPPVAPSSALPEAAGRRTPVPRTVAAAEAAPPRGRETGVVATGPSPDRAFAFVARASAAPGAKDLFLPCGEVRAPMRPADLVPGAAVEYAVSTDLSGRPYASHVTPLSPGVPHPFVRQAAGDVVATLALEPAAVPQRAGRDGRRGGTAVVVTASGRRAGGSATVAGLLPPGAAAVRAALGELLAATPTNPAAASGSGRPRELVARIPASELVAAAAAAAADAIARTVEASRPHLLAIAALADAAPGGTAKPNRRGRGHAVKAVPPSALAPHVTAILAAVGPGVPVALEWPAGCTEVVRPGAAAASAPTLVAGDELLVTLRADLRDVSAALGRAAAAPGWPAAAAAPEQRALAAWAAVHAALSAGSARVSRVSPARARGEVVAMASGPMRISLDRLGPALSGGLGPQWGALRLVGHAASLLPVDDKKGPGSRRATLAQGEPLAALTFAVHPSLRRADDTAAAAAAADASGAATAGPSTPPARVVSPDEPAAAPSPLPGVSPAGGGRADLPSPPAIAEGDVVEFSLVPPNATGMSAIAVRVVRLCRRVDDLWSTLSAAGPDHESWEGPRFERRGVNAELRRSQTGARRPQGGAVEAQSPAQVGFAAGRGRGAKPATGAGAAPGTVPGASASAAVPRASPAAAPAQRGAERKAEPASSAVGAATAAPVLPSPAGRFEGMGGVTGAAARIAADGAGGASPGPNARGRSGGRGRGGERGRDGERNSSGRGSRGRDGERTSGGRGSRGGGGRGGRGGGRGAGGRGGGGRGGGERGGARD